MATLIFDNYAWSVFSFDLAKVRCESCGHEWTAPEDTASTPEWADCPACGRDVVRVLQPGPSSVRMAGR